MNRIIPILIFLMSIISIEVLSQEVEVINIGPLNTADDEIAPVLTQYGAKLYITRDVNGKGQKVMISTMGKRIWENPNTIDGEVNDATQSGSMTFTPDGQYMIFAAYEHDVNGEGRTDLYSARRVAGEWTDIENLGVAINSPYWDSQPALSSDGRTLYFASDRPGGVGGSDIYVSTRTREGWTEAKPLGRMINTEKDEMTPFVAYDDKTFTFASNRDGGEGGFDIYFSKYEGRAFTRPQNAGDIINSPKDEFFYIIRANTDIAYYSSMREGTKGGLDIFAAVPNPHQAEKVVVVNGIVTDAETGDKIGTDIIITDLTSGEEVASLRSDDETGRYYAVLQTGKEYSLTADKLGYVFHSESFSISKDPKETELIRDIELFPIANGKTTLLVFFDFDKSELKEESIPELNRVINFLNKNENIRIAIEGHTDDQGENEYNMNLSKERARSVKKYLVDKGVSEARIEYKGYGETKPLMQGTTDAARAKNRRVEMVIISN